MVELPSGYERAKLRERTTVETKYYKMTTLFGPTLVQTTVEYQYSDEDETYPGHLQEERSLSRSRIIWFPDLVCIFRHETL